MLLRSMSAENYRSLRSIRMDLGRVNLFVGENGAGKSNLYRSLQLVQAAVRGTFANEIAAEGDSPARVKRRWIVRGTLLLQMAE